MGGQIGKRVIDFFTFSNYLLQDNWTSVTIDNVKTKIKDTDTRPSLRRVLHLLTPSTTSRQRSETRIPTCLCSRPFIIDNVKAKIQDMDTHPSLHHRQRQGKDSRHRHPPVSASSTTSRQRFKTPTPTRLCTIDNVKAKIQDTDTRPSLRRVLHLLTPSTMSRRTPKTDTRSSLRCVHHHLTPSTTSRRRSIDYVGYLDT